ncbi:MAG: flagellar protein FlgN [Desulfatirhabdiaceae bacterium]
MNNLLNELTITLDELVGRCQDLLETVTSEKQALLKVSIDDLYAIRKKKENLIQEIQTIDVRRFRLLSGLAIMFKVDPKNLTISRLSELVVEPYTEKLFRLSVTLSNLLKSIQLINKANQSLLNHSISFVRSAVGFLSHLLASPPVYYRTGKVSSEDISGRLLSGAA